MIGFCPLASGSKGNAIYLGTKEVKILIDAGLSGRAIKNKLAEIDVNIEDIDAILITHEHSDHIQALPVLAMRMGIPVIANSETAKGIVENLNACPKFKIFSTGETFEFGDLEIHPFSIQHDTADPVAFTIKTAGLKLGFCTDLGFVSTLVLRQLALCDYLYIEANHEPDMVYASSRPMTYKQRVLGRSGHLSNQACAELIDVIHHDKLRHIHLAHLSQECNVPEKALAAIESVLSKKGSKTPVAIAYQGIVGPHIEF